MEVGWPHIEDVGVAYSSNKQGIELNSLQGPLQHFDYMRRDVRLQKYSH